VLPTRNFNGVLTATRLNRYTRWIYHVESKAPRGAVEVLCSLAQGCFHMTIKKLCPAVLALLLTACNQSTYSLDTALSVGTIPRGTKSLKYGDSKPVPIKGTQPAQMAVHGIDVSRYNKKINWRVAKSAGIEFAFVKATEGKDDRDADFRKHWAGAARAGMARGAYHFYYFCASPEAQARNYMRVVPKSERSLPPVLDVEWNPKSPTCRKRPSPAKVRNVMKRWLRIVERHYGQKPIIYVPVDFYEDNLAGGHLPGYQYWLRSVRTEPKYKFGNRPWRFWQYTGTGRVPGIVGDVDINAFNGSASDWKKWVASNTR